MTGDEAQRDPGTHMAPQLATGAKAEPLPTEVITQFRDALVRLDTEPIEQEARSA